MMDTATLFTYIITCVIAAGTPGPGTMSVIAYSGLYGWRKTIPVIAGIQLGMFAMAVLSLSGLSAVITTSETFFVLLQYVGGAYIAWLGISSILASRHKNGQFSMQVGDNGVGKNLYHGAIVTFASPKTLLFFTSFFPLFIDPHRSIFQQNTFLLLILLLCTLVVHIVYTFLMSRMTHFFQQYQSEFNLFVGIVFLLLALYMVIGISF